MKNYFKTIILVSILIASLAACVKEDHFGKTPLKQILYFAIEGQAGNARIVEDSLLIYVKVSSAVDIKALTLDSVKLSTFAKLSPDPKRPQDFSTPFTYTVTAEDGTTAVYTVSVQQEGNQPQLENSAFDDWYTPSGKSYQQPGADAGSIWASANDGVTTTGANNFNTTPLLISGIDYAAQLVTKDLGFIAQIAGQRIGSATLFVGKFALNISNPSASTQFGTPFTAKPIGFSIDYNYKEGAPYKDGANKTLNKIDSADLYVLLENRTNPNAIKRIATGWFRAGNSASATLAKIDVPLVYGMLPAKSPSYQKPENGLYGTKNDPVTHIVVVYASSANGILYEGAVNSTLLLNNFKLKY